MKYYISVLVENKAGILTRISGLFSRRNFNIDSLVGGTTDNPAVSRITIVVDGDDYVVDQVTKQLGKLIDVLAVKRLDPDFMVQRELTVIKVNLDADKHEEIFNLIRNTGCEVIDAFHRTFIIKLDDNSANVDLFIEQMSKYGIVEIVRTGAIAVAKGEDSIFYEND